MLAAAAIVPSPPLLIPPLGGVTDPEVLSLRSGVSATVRLLARSARRWTVLGVGDAAERLDSDAAGTLLGFGADVWVGLSAAATGPARADLPLPALVAGGLRETAGGDVSCDAVIVAADTDPVECAAIGRGMRAELDAAAEPRGILVVADGAATLTEKAPGYYDERAQGDQQALIHALSTGDRDALARLDPRRCVELGVSGRAAFQVLAAAVPAEPSVVTCYVGAPFGVGYFAGVWDL